MPYENYQVADESPIELQVKQRKGMSESPEERQLGVALRERSTVDGNLASDRLGISSPEGASATISSLKAN